MPHNSAFEGNHRIIGSDVPGCWIGATPEVRRRLLGLAVAVLAPAVIPASADAQNTASGTVRLVIRADALPPGALQMDSEAILWMAPESVQETERSAALWAAGDDAGALKAWQAVVKAEVEAERLATDEQADAAAEWIAARAARLARREVAGDTSGTQEEWAKEIRGVARSTAVASIESLD
ncbi:MAG: hypothetical protein WBO43_07155 [Gemmatimonadota bacterium]